MQRDCVRHFAPSTPSQWRPLFEVSFFFFWAERRPLCGAVEMIPHGIQKRGKGGPGLVGGTGQTEASGAAVHAKTGDAAALHDSAKEASRHGNDAEAYRLLSAGLELAHEAELRSELLLARSVTCARLHRWEVALQASVHGAERALVRRKS